MEDNWMSKLACVTGVGMGALAWFVLLSFGVGTGKFSTQTLLRMSHVSAACMLIAALFIGGRLVMQLSKSPELKSRVKKLEKQIQEPFRR